LEIELYDATARLIQQIPIYQGSTIAYFDTRKLYSGNYFVKMKGEGTAAFRKVLITK